jgi:DNA-binding CsgD family transcriptional regulator
MLLWRAAARLGVPANAADAAMSAGVLTHDRAIDFRHPLIRSAVYGGADAAERRRVHEALAAVSDPVRTPERRAWHRAEATIGLDDEVARELDSASERARSRGGYAARAAFLARAADLSVAGRAGRLVEAARAYLVLGDPVSSQAMLEQAEPLLTAGDPVLRARALHAKATTGLYFGRIAGVPPLMQAAAAAIADEDPALARSMLVEGLLAALFGDHRKLREFGREVLASPVLHAAEPTAADLLLQGFAIRLGTDYPSAVPVLQAALAAVCKGEEIAEAGMPIAALTAYAAEEVCDEGAGLEAARVLEAHERRTGALGALRTTLAVRSLWELRTGRFAAATACLDEIEDLAAVVGQQSPLLTIRIELLAWSGEEAATRAAADFFAGDRFEPHSHDGYAGWVQHCLTVLELSLGRYAEAAACARVAFVDDDPGLAMQGLPDLVEAAVRSGDHRTAKQALGRLEERAPLAGTPWALGLLARCRALMADDEHAEAFYEESMDLLGRTRMRPELARTHLLYGEWLRRRKRRGEARTQLRTAHEMFADMGAAAWADRARVELQATGERARKRTVQTEHHLTPQERRIAELAADGATNAEIATRLFITQSTVEYHLNKIFRKLDITSRRSLRTVMHEEE